MELSLSYLLAMIRETLRDPKAGARAIMALRLPLGTRWVAFFLMVVLSALLTHASFALLPAEMQAMLGEVMARPIRTAQLQAGALLFTVIGVHRIGRLFGGRGQFDDALILMVWLQFVMLCVQVVQLVVQVLMPPFADLIGLLGLGMLMWLMVNFIAELHGFASLIRVFIGTVLSIIVLGFAAVMLLIVLLGGRI
jgi:hypothetical protein